MYFPFCVRFEQYMTKNLGFLDNSLGEISWWALSEKSSDADLNKYWETYVLPSAYRLWGTINKCKHIFA